MNGVPLPMIPVVVLVKTISVFLVWALVIVLIPLTLISDGLEWLIDEWYA